MTNRYSMKKIYASGVFFLMVLNVYANTSTRDVVKKVDGKIVTAVMKKTNLTKKTKTCRVTCTITGTDMNGNIYEVTVTAGSIFRSCETAGELACARAYDQLEEYINRANQPVI